MHISKTSIAFPVCLMSTWNIPTPCSDVFQLLWSHMVKLRARSSAEHVAILHLVMEWSVQGSLQKHQSALVHGYSSLILTAFYFSCFVHACLSEMQLACSWPLKNIICQLKSNMLNPCVFPIDVMCMWRGNDYALILLHHLWFLYSKGILLWNSVEGLILQGFSFI